MTEDLLGIPIIHVSLCRASLVFGSDMSLAQMQVAKNLQWNSENMVEKQFEELCSDDKGFSCVSFLLLSIYYIHIPLFLQGPQSTMYGCPPPPLFPTTVLQRKLGYPQLVLVDVIGYPTRDWMTDSLLLHILHFCG